MYVLSSLFQFKGQLLTDLSSVLDGLITFFAAQSFSYVLVRFTGRPTEAVDWPESTGYEVRRQHSPFVHDRVRDSWLIILGPLLIFPSSILAEYISTWFVVTA